MSSGAVKLNEELRKAVDNFYDLAVANAYFNAYSQKLEEAISQKIDLKDAYDEALENALTLGGNLDLVDEVYNRMREPGKYLNELEFVLVTQSEYNKGYEDIYWGTYTPAEYLKQFPDRISESEAQKYEKEGKFFAVFDDGSNDYDDDVYAAVQYYNDAMSIESDINAVDADIQTFIAGMSEYYEKSLAFDDEFGNSLDGIKDNTEKTVEELTYLRDLAEREAINRFTTAEVKIDMSGMNNRIDSEADFDGFIGLLSNGLAAALSVAAERAEV